LSPRKVDSTFPNRGLKTFGEDLHVIQKAG
jgi:hypothetical protein